MEVVKWGKWECSRIFRNLVLRNVERWAKIQIRHKTERKMWGWGSVVVYVLFG